MLTHPDQRRAVERDPSLWSTVFDETIRWVAPIGLYSRQTTKRTVLAGVELPEGAQLGICILSADRDPTIGGWVFRGMLSLPVTWRDVKPLAKGRVPVSTGGPTPSATEAEATPARRHCRLWAGGLLYGKRSPAPHARRPYRSV